MPRGDEAIAAIVARAAQDRDAAGIGKPPDHLIGNRAPGILHETRPRHAPFDGEAIGSSHLLCGQKLEHVLGLPWQALSV